MSSIRFQQSSVAISPCSPSKRQVNRNERTPQVATASRPSRWTGRPGLALTLLLLWWSSAGAGAADIGTLLGRPILSPETAVEEVQRFVEARIPEVPDARSGSDWSRKASRLRETVLDKVVFRGEAARWRDARGQVEWLGTLVEHPEYIVRKLRYEAVPGLWIPAVLYVPTGLKGKVPVSLAVNGHEPVGKAAAYKQLRCINQAKRGMLVLNVEWFGMGQLRTDRHDHSKMNQLDLCGTSGIAPFYLAMSRAIDVLLSLEHADPSRVVVSGLSGGGWQTIFISSLDPRVTLANPVAGYSSFKTRIRHWEDLGDSEQTPSDLATVVDYTHLTAMRAPRPTLLTFNETDNCCFATPHALPPLVEEASPIFGLFGKSDFLRTHNNTVPGTHNYDVDNRQQFYRMVGDHFFAEDSDFSASEIPSEAEVLTPQALEIPLPAKNENFNSLARELARALPRSPEIPTVPKLLVRWQNERRPLLEKLVAARRYDATAEMTGEEQSGGISARYWKLKLSETWTVPIVELARGETTQCSLIVADGGRTNAQRFVEQELAAGRRVFAMDPFYFGESRFLKRDYLFALIVAATGERPLGIQAAQITAAARWIRSLAEGMEVRLVGVGPRLGLAATIASALEPKAIQALELHQPLGSLKEIIEKNWGATEKPELFSFGLLESFDIPQLLAMSAPRPLTLSEPSPRVVREVVPVEKITRVEVR